MDAIDRLIDFYNRTESDAMYHAISGNALSHIHEFSSASIYDAADMCYTSTASISRLIKKLGYNSYSDFRSQIRHALQHYRQLNKILGDIELTGDTDIIASYYDLWQNGMETMKQEIHSETLKEVCRCLYSADEVIFYTVPMPCINALQKSMAISGKKTECHDASSVMDLQSNTYNENAVILTTAMPFMEMSHILKILKHFALNGAKAIILCSDTREAYKKYAAHILAFRGNGTVLDQYLFSTLVYLIQLEYQRSYVYPIIEKLFE